MRSLSVKYKTALLFADQAIFSGTSFMVTVLLARSLSVEDFGLYAAIILVLYLISSLISAFVIQPLQVSLQATENKPAYLAFTFWFQLAGSIALIVLMYILLLLPFPILSAYAMLAVPAALFSAGFMMQDYLRKRLLTEDRIAETFITDTLLMAGHFAAAGYIFLYGIPSLYLVITLLGLGYLPALAAGFIFVRPPMNGFSLWSGYLKEHLDQGKWLFYTALVQWWAGNLFVVASGFFLGATALGALRLVQTVFGVLNVLFQTFENYVLPQTASRMHHSFDEGRCFLRKIGGQTFVAVSALLLILFVFSDTIIVLAGGEQFRAYGFLVKGMAVLYALIFAGYPIRIAIRALVLNKVFFKGYVLTFIFGVLSSYLLLSHFDLAGAVAGLIGSQIILLIYWQIQLKKREFILWK
ncbi:MAG: oligosaccharide flippase family protein [Bacteroidetes bacterium]|nr:oligosaccharide flippase family protein [Bacteroidota bacterium]